MKVLIRLFILSAIAIGVVGNQPAQAHEDFRFEEKVGGKTARLIINGDELEANDLLAFAFDLSDAKGSTIDFSTMGIRVVLKGRGLLLSTLLHANSNWAFLSYTFPTGGEYEIAVGYNQNNMPVAETVFTVKVDPRAVPPASEPQSGKSRR